MDVQTHTPEATSAPTGWRTTFSSLANRDFRFLWIGMLALAAGVEMEMVAVGYLVYDLTDSPLLLGVVEAGFGLPTLAFALFGGLIADRLDKKYVIQISQSLEAVVALVVGILIITDNINWTYLLLMALVEGSLFSFMMPARQAIVPRLVEPHQLTNAMAINSAAFSAMTLMSPMFAGQMYRFVGPGAVFLAITSMKVVSVLMTTKIRRVPPTREEVESNSAVEDIKDGLVYVFRTRIVLVLLVFGLASVLLSWPFHTLIPVFVVDIYGRGPEAMGWMLTALGFGALVGSLYIASKGRWHRGLILILGGIITSLALFLVAAIPFYYAAIAIMILVGLGEGAWWALSMALTMEHTEDRFRGRVSSISMLTFGLMPLGVLPAGVAAEYLGGQVTVAILASLLLTVCLIFLITQKLIREMQ